MNNRRALDLQPAVSHTNHNPAPTAWNDEPDKLADDDFEGYDGTVELAVWRRSYRVYRWRNGTRIGAGTGALSRMSERTSFVSLSSYLLAAIRTPPVLASSLLC